MGLALMRMDILNSWIIGEEYSYHDDNPIVQTQGEFVDALASGDVDKTKPAEEGAAVEDATAAVTKKKKSLPKGAHRA